MTANGRSHKLTCRCRICEPWVQAIRDFVEKQRTRDGRQ